MRADPLKSLVKTDMTYSSSHEENHPSPEIEAVAPGERKYRVIRRNGKTTPFDSLKIYVALTKAFLAVEGNSAVVSKRVHEICTQLTANVEYALSRSQPGGGTFHIEDIQDHAELALMRGGHHQVARTYILYREERNKERQKQEGKQASAAKDRESAAAANIQIVYKDGNKRPLDLQYVRGIVEEACSFTRHVNAEAIIEESLRNLYDGMSIDDLNTVFIISARALIERDPHYSYASARLLLHKLRREALSFIGGQHQESSAEEMGGNYPKYFQQYLRKGIELKLLDHRLIEQFDLDKLGRALQPERDMQFTYLGLQTLYDRYFIRHESDRESIPFEMPQAFFMRVAMGLAINEIESDTRAIEFYRLLSSFDFMSSTPTLFNSGTPLPQLSSCYLTTVPDNLRGIFESVRDNALLSKFAGGLGNDWSRVRAMGSYIASTNGKSQGVTPFLKVANDTAVAVNQGGKRKGAVCSYLETWHLDIEEFIKLRRNTGDDRRRTHDMNTANWIPDLFMKRVHEESYWTLFSPSDVSDLHDLYGKAFEERYLAYEALAEQGKLRHKKVKANDLWRDMISMLYETGHPWMTFKDPCNIRSPQRHRGVVHSSNLCTEITLNTSEEEIAVCNLGSINLVAHIDENGLMEEKLAATIETAMRMLDNVIEYNYYAVRKARDSNFRHRPVGLGLMGFQDALYKLRIPYQSQEAIDFADRTMETISYYAIKSSNQLAQERGPYSTFAGSLWSQGILPIDSCKEVAAARGEQYFSYNNESKYNWNALRASVKAIGMRNSNTMAIAPTATISNICGVTQSIEPTYQNLFVKSNLSGEFTVVNPYLVEDLKKLEMWDDVMVNDLKYYDGSVKNIDRIPDELKKLYATAFEIDQTFLIEAAARRQKWIDQSQSLNLYMSEPSGKKLDKMYKLAWISGLKTTYYLRSRGATHVEKSTMETKYASGLNAVEQETSKECPIDDPTCEACQ